MPYRLLPSSCRWLWIKRYRSTDERNVCFYRRLQWGTYRELLQKTAETIWTWTFRWQIIWQKDIWLRFWKILQKNSWFILNKPYYMNLKMGAKHTIHWFSSNVPVCLLPFLFSIKTLYDTLPEFLPEPLFRCNIICRKIKFFGLNFFYDLHFISSCDPADIFPFSKYDHKIHAITDTVLFSSKHFPAGLPV